jgi:CrcB protein
VTNDSYGKKAPREFIGGTSAASLKGGTIVRFFWICFGGACGTGARYLLSGWALDRFGAAFPYGTLAVNLIGSFLVAVIVYVGVDAGMMSPTVRLALTTGVMGGFTTYSTFSYETMRYLQDGAWELASLNVLVHVFGGLVACFLGWASAEWLIAPS